MDRENREGEKGLRNPRNHQVRERVQPTSEPFSSKSWAVQYVRFPSGPPPEY